MHTDELRAELSELAREVDPFAADLGTVRHRVARRRIASASVAVVIVIGLVAGGIALTRPGSNHVHVAGTEKQVTIARLSRFDAAVILPAGATAADAAQVQAILDNTDVVENYAPLPVGTLVTALAFTRAKGAKALLAHVCAAPPNHLYAVQLSRSQGDPLPPLITATGTAATVHSIGLDGGRNGADAEVFMRVRATADQVAAVSAAIGHDPDVTKVTFIGREAAMREFKKLFSRQPILITNTKASDLPVSFRLVVRDGASFKDLEERYRVLPGVDAVNTPGTQFWAASGISLADACRPNP